MMEYLKLTKLKFRKKRLVIVYLFSVGLFYLCAIFSAVEQEYPLEPRCLFTGSGDFPLQIFKNTLGQRNALVTYEGFKSSLLGTRKLLAGPGSSPPRCVSKCGKCKPCQPVHVPVPPGTPVTAEYYPEAWRCKCGKKLYMP